jgi:hypothetical protein
MKKYSTGVSSIDTMLTLCSVKISTYLKNWNWDTHMESVVISQALFLSCHK